MLDTITPTDERLSKSAFVAPSTDQRSKRPAYKALSIFETLYVSGKLTNEEWQAAERLTTHYLGSLGVKVGDGHGCSADDRQPAQTVHSSELAHLQKTIDCGPTWRALLDTVQELATPQEIGRRITPDISNRPQLYTAGLVVLKLGLRKIARIAPRSRDRP